MIDIQPMTNGQALATSRTTARPTVSNGRRMTYSRVIGALFLVGFLTYGVGFSLVTSIVGGSNFLCRSPQVRRP
jgi:hypothetical protein